MRDGDSRPKLFAGLRDYGFVIIFIAVVAFFSLTTTTFLTPDNILSLLHETVPLAIMGLGLALVVMTAKLDISIGSIAFLSSAVGMLLMAHNGLPAEIGLPLIVLVGTVCGLVNGLVCVYLRVNPLITTMGAMFVYRGLALQLTSSRAISVSRGLRDLGNARLGPFFFDIAVAAALMIVIFVVLKWTPFGRRTLAIGSNADAAAKLGVRVRRTSLATFVLSGFFAGLGGIFWILQIGSVNNQMGTGMEFKAIAAIVIGGISLFGGEGSIFPNYALGVMTLGIIENGLNLLGVSPYLYPFVRGGIILVAMWADSMKRRSGMADARIIDSTK
jgi:ribose/xylose/arabinose/galactoside ABC-type transport system permease subunit